METVFINGTVGVGKSTLADALSELETEPHAVLDLDGIRRMSPSSEGDPFNHELELRNLRDLVANFRAAGAERLILAGVIEQKHDVPRYLEAIAAGRIFICRLVAPPAVIQSRIMRRHADDEIGRQWHLARSAELSNILERADLDDYILDATTATPQALARQLRSACDWEDAAT